METVGEVMNWRMSIKTFTSVPAHGSVAMKGAVSSYSYRLLVRVQIGGMRAALSVGVGVWENEQLKLEREEWAQRSLWTPRRTRILGTAFPHMLPTHAVGSSVMRTCYDITGIWMFIWARSYICS